MNANMSVTVRQVDYFVAIAEHGSFRKAADSLGVTQPALTGQMNAMERQLDVQLFERSRSGVLLTAAARELLTHARRIQEEISGFHQVANRLSGHGLGTYRLGVTPTLGPYLLPRILPGLHQAYDSLRLYVREAAPAQLEQSLLAGEFDLLFTTLPIQSQELEVVPMFREPVQLVLSMDHRLARKKRINRSDLFGEQVLTMDEHHLYHRQINELCESLGATPRRDFEGTSLDTLRQMVVMGMGIAFLPALYVASEIREHEVLRVTNVQGAELLRHHAIVWRQRSPVRGLFREIAADAKKLVKQHFQGAVYMT